MRKKEINVCIKHTKSDMRVVDWLTFQTTADSHEKNLNEKSKHPSREPKMSTPNGPMLMKNLYSKLHTYLNFYHFYVACHFLFLSRPQTNIHTLGSMRFKMTKINAPSGLMVLVVVQWDGVDSECLFDVC